MLKVSLTCFVMICAFSLFTLLNMYGPKRIPHVEMEELSEALTGGDMIQLSYLDAAGL